MIAYVSIRVFGLCFIFKKSTRDSRFPVPIRFVVVVRMNPGRDATRIYTLINNLFRARR